MKNDIELRDFFAAQLMSGKVDDFYRAAYRENIAKEKETEIWKQVSAKEATKRAIDTASKNAYTIADAMINARKK